jgi:hypothetical protein
LRAGEGDEKRKFMMIHRAWGGNGDRHYRMDLGEWSRFITPSDPRNNGGNWIKTGGVINWLTGLGEWMVGWAHFIVFDL